MNSITLPQINIPGIQSNSKMLSAYNHSPAYQDSTVETTIELLFPTVRYIIDREMDQLRRDNPAFDTEKIQTMWQSMDPEMRSLAIETMKIYSRYTWQFMNCIRPGNWTTNIHELERIIIDYNENNKFNLGGRVL